MLRTEELVKSIKSEDIEDKILRKINIAIGTGEFVSIAGPSGSGKSTLLNILGMLDTPTSGKYWFDGEDVTTYSDSRRTRLRKGDIGFVFRGAKLIDNMSVFHNIELPLLYQGVSFSQRKKRVNEVLEKIRLAHRKKNYPGRLTRGQQQQVSIARAMVSNPKLVLADEPAGDLNSTDGEEVIHLLTQINNQGTTVVMATHSTTYANKAHRIVQLFDGQVLMENLWKYGSSMLLNCGIFEKNTGK